jgi:indole-3-glycerol phosphate synthase
MKDNFLARIVRQRRASIDPLTDFAALRRQAEAARTARQPHALRRALCRGLGIHIIGEFKRASPSAGMIRDDVAAAAAARTYARAGVSAISVLTEPHYFHGSLDDVREVRGAVDVPILRKDFIVHETQIDEAAIAGADAVLLIVAALAERELTALMREAQSLQLDALIEVHSADEMRRAGDVGAELIGVNNRDLASLDVSLDTSVQLAALAPAGAVLISESGIKTPDDVARLAACGYRAFLIGESLMRAADPGALISKFRAAAAEPVNVSTE